MFYDPACGRRGIKAMRIGLVTGEFPPMEGGVGAFTDQLARSLAALDHEIHIITSTKARPVDQPKTLASLRNPLDLGYAQVYARVGRWRWPSLATVALVAIEGLRAKGYDIVAVELTDDAVGFGRVDDQRRLDVERQLLDAAAAGMARAGLRPIVAIYSTVLNRAWDQVVYPSLTKM